jgi:hypothetical protein
VELLDGLNSVLVCACAMTTDIASSKVGVKPHKGGMGSAERQGLPLVAEQWYSPADVLDSGRCNKTKPIPDFAAQTLISESEKQAAMIVDRKKRPPSVRLNQDGPFDRSITGTRFSNFLLRENCQKCER